MTTVPHEVPEATAYRLSLYHCYLGEALRADPDVHLTSKALAERLDLKEETVRRDISFVGSVGKPGAGYSGHDLFQAIQTFLGLKEQYPIVRIGSIEVLRALDIVFPPEAYGVKPVAYYSENPEDVGQEIDGISVQHVTAITEIDRELDVKVALVASSREWIQIVIDLCAKAGIEGILLLTPILTVERPPGVNVTQIRMPCDIKSLACRCRPRPGDDRD